LIRRVLKKTIIKIKIKKENHSLEVGVERGIEIIAVISARITNIMEKHAFVLFLHIKGKYS